MLARILVAFILIDGGAAPWAGNWVDDALTVLTTHLTQIKELLANLQAQKRGGKDTGSSGGAGLLAAKAKISSGAGKRQETAPAA